ncbi:MAG: 30S ribosome-binding factor RbfA [Candidatus Adiutrix sp.]|jgi:ribosome-binding factor A|nr:30S ribosome-binding factor RbfA [Candidatus Adiutrix sp.]
MTQRRLEKMNELLKEAVAVLLLQRSKDPRLQQVNVTAAKMTADLKRAVILYSLLGGEGKKSAVQKALDRAAGFVRAAVGETLGLKHTPEIKFEFDRNLEYAQHMSELLSNLSQDKAGVEDHDR